MIIDDSFNGSIIDEGNFDIIKKENIIVGKTTKDKIDILLSVYKAFTHLNANEYAILKHCVLDCIKRTNDLNSPQVVIMLDKDFYNTINDDLKINKRNAKLAVDSLIQKHYLHNMLITNRNEYYKDRVRLADNYFSNKILQNNATHLIIKL